MSDPRDTDSETPEEHHEHHKIQKRMKIMENFFGKYKITKEEREHFIRNWDGERSDNNDDKSEEEETS